VVAVDSYPNLFLYYALFRQKSGQVAQLVERGPEKAGVGGSIPSLAKPIFNNLQATGRDWKHKLAETANLCFQKLSANLCFQERP
jgi:hypothetical protein